MKRIAISSRLDENLSYPETRQALDIRWIKLFEKLEFMPIILPFGYDIEFFYSHVGFDGIILSGGNDLFSFLQNDLSKQRDEWEKSLIDFALQKNLPLFGLCRGMQIIAEYFECSFKKIQGQVGIKEHLSINKQSRYAKYLNTLDEVNSYASYFIDRLSDELIASATNSQNLIKAVEHKEKKIFAQMWHSEREEPFSKEQISLIKSFFS